MMHILGTGLSGLVGSRIVELLSQEIVFTDLSRSQGVDITDAKAVTQFIQEKNPDVILHLAAMTDVDAAEKEKGLGEASESWRINVEGTQHVVNAAESLGKKLIYVSTDFVFDGQSPPENGYSEDDTPHPINWYGQTKYEGEKVVRTSRVPWLILRPAVPYRRMFEKNDFFRAILSRLQAGQTIEGVEDQWITPTFIDDIAYSVRILLEREQTGIFHTVGSEFITPYEAAGVIAQAYNIDMSLIKPVSREKFFLGRAERPFKSILNNGKIKKLGVYMKTFEEGLEDIKNNF